VRVAPGPPHVFLPAHHHFTLPAMPDKWVCSSNDALRLSLVRGGADDEPLVFAPTFTYPIFGEAEAIYGYANLAIALSFAAASLTPCLRVSYDAKNERTTTEIDDVAAKMREILPEDDVFDDAAALAELARRERCEGAFKPLGELVHSYTRPAAEPKSAAAGKGKGKGKGRARGQGESSSAGASSSAAAPAEERHFEIYHATWATPGFRELHRRMQVFTLLFIEGASYIQEDEAAWEWYVLYERLPPVSPAGPPGYAFAGYTSLYRFWCYPASSRVRLSQFVVLPPFQGAGHGSALYTHVLDSVIAASDVQELTVEDPSEAFDRVRDGSDLRRLFSQADGFANDAKKHGRLLAPVDAKWSEEQRLKRKIAPRQWGRLVEMVMLLNLDQEDVAQCKKYRLQVSRAWRGGRTGHKGTRAEVAAAPRQLWQHPG
jgi:histone acetyltransferase 1